MNSAQTSKNLSIDQKRVISKGVADLAKDLARHIFEHRFSASKWILAGTLAFIYSMLVDPKGFAAVYGGTFSKIAMGFYVLSLLFGVLSAVDSLVCSKLKDSQVLKGLVDYIESSVEKVETVDEKDSSGDLKEMIKNELSVWFDDLWKNRGQSYLFLLQAGAFLAATGVLLIKFFGQ